MERRLHTRHRARTTVYITVPGSGRRLCRAVNLSATGVFIQTTNLGLRKGQNVELVFAINLGAITKLHRECKIPLTRIVELFTAGPARVFDLRGRGSLVKGNVADVTVFDPKKKWTFEAGKSRSLSHNTPFDGWQFRGKVVATIVGGKVVYRAG